MTELSLINAINHHCIVINALTKNAVDRVVLPGVSFVSTAPSQQPADGAHRWRAILVADAVLHDQKRELVANSHLAATPFLSAGVLWTMNKGKINNNK
jgi:hypothetical protein